MSKRPTRHLAALGVWIAVIALSGAALSLAAASDDPSDTPSAEQLERGSKLFKLCAQCHKSDGGGDRLSQAPAIAGFSSWYIQAQLEKFKSGARGLHPDDIFGMRMRPMALTLMNDADLLAISGYVASLPSTRPDPEVEGGDAAQGAVLYATCAACHGAAGEGNQVLQGPSLNRTNDWYLVRQLENFKVGIRGSDPQDMAGIMMRPMAMMLANDQAVRDVVAHIVSLSE